LPTIYEQYNYYLDIVVMLIEMKYFFVRLVRIIRIQRIKIYYFKMPKKSLFL